MGDDREGVFDAVLQACHFHARVGRAFGLSAHRVDDRVARNGSAVRSGCLEAHESTARAGRGRGHLLRRVGSVQDLDDDAALHDAVRVVRRVHDAVDDDHVTVEARLGAHGQHVAIARRGALAHVHGRVQDHERIRERVRRVLRQVHGRRLTRVDLDACVRRRYEGLRGLHDRHRNVGVDRARAVVHAHRDRADRPLGLVLLARHGQRVAVQGHVDAAGDLHHTIVEGALRLVVRVVHHLGEINRHVLALAHENRGRGQARRQVPRGLNRDRDRQRRRQGRLIIDRTVTHREGHRGAARGRVGRRQHDVRGILQRRRVDTAAGLDRRRVGDHRGTRVVAHEHVVVDVEGEGGPRTHRHRDARHIEARSQQVRARDRHDGARLEPIGVRHRVDDEATARVRANRQVLAGHAHARAVR